jgi:hypothetical protein
MNAYKQQAVAGSPRLMRMSDFELESILRQRSTGLGEFTFLCPACGIRLQAEWGAMSRLGRCPVCEIRFPVPPQS